MSLATTNVHTVATLWQIHTKFVEIMPGKHGSTWWHWQLHTLTSGRVHLQLHAAAILWGLPNTLRKNAFTYPACVCHALHAHGVLTTGEMSSMPNNVWERKNTFSGFYIFWGLLTCHPARGISPSGAVSGWLQLLHYLRPVDSRLSIFLHWVAVQQILE